MPLRVQMPRRQRDRFAGADQQRGVLFELLEHGARHRDGSRCHRHGIGADARLRANALGDREGRLQQAIQIRPGDAFIERGAIGILQLTEDLRFAEHQGVQAAGDREQMLDRSGVRVSRYSDCLNIEIVVGQVVPVGEPTCVSGIGAGVRKAIQLGAIAGRDDERFAHAGDSRPVRAAPSGSSSLANTTFSRMSTGAVR